MGKSELILDKLDKIEQYIFGLKEILNVEELVSYTGFSKSHIYKLVHKSMIPYSKPGGKVLFFERKKIDLWLLGNSFKSSASIYEDALKYVENNKATKS